MGLIEKRIYELEGVIDELHIKLNDPNYIELKKLLYRRLQHNKSLLEVNRQLKELVEGENG